LLSSAFFTYSVGENGFWVLIIAALAYLIGTIGITAFGNVPLNKELDALKLEQLTIETLSDFRKYYESRWNRLHTLRMLCAVFSFIVALLAKNIEFKN
ncbi:MAG: DUF1772 domain-containing protein, partial [Bacteroidota bacterium]